MSKPSLVALSFLRRSAPAPTAVVGLLDLGNERREERRRFSSTGRGGGRDGSHGGRGGQGGRDGRGDRGGRGRGAGAFGRFREKTQHKKENFADKFLIPAEKGELPFGTRVPRLAARKHKSLTPSSDPFSVDDIPDEMEEEALAEEEELEQELRNEARERLVRGEGGRRMAMPRTDDGSSLMDEVIGVGGITLEDAVKFIESGGKELPDPSVLESQGILLDSDAEDDDYDEWDPESHLTEDDKEKITYLDDGNVSLDVGGEDEDEDQDGEVELDRENGKVNNLENFEEIDEDDIREEDLFQQYQAKNYDPNKMEEESEYNEGDEDIDFELNPRQEEDKETGELIPEDVEEAFFRQDVLDFTQPFPDTPEAIANQVVPLRDHGPQLDDFVEAMIEHPTKYAQISRENPHAESLREAVADKPKGRVNPSTDFVTSHARFIFVTGMPHPVFDGELGDFQNRLHRHSVAELAASLFDAPVIDVSPANMTSAFIGFQDPLKAKLARKNGPVNEYISHPIKATKYEGTNHADFASAELVVQLDDIPAGWTSSRLSKELFTSELQEEYGVLEADDVLILSPTSALIRLSSTDLVERMLTSVAIQTQFEELGKSYIRYFTAKRELVFAGFTGPANAFEVRKKGNRLRVSGDVPEKEFYRTHGAVLHLRNLDSSVSEDDINTWAQPFCTNHRLAESVNFVTCYKGHKTGKAFVGFDRIDEAEAALKASSGLVKLGVSHANIKMVRDRKMRRGYFRHDERPRRSTKTLLADLNKWEEYVDPADLKELESVGVRRDILHDIFTTLRRDNRTFAIEDNAIRGERVDDGEIMGTQYKKVVQRYIELLKKCIATPENPGMLYEAIHMPDEEIDLSVFKWEKERQQRLRAFEKSRMEK